MWAGPRIAALFRGGSARSRLPAAYLLYSFTHRNIKQAKGSGQWHQKSHKKNKIKRKLWWLNLCAFVGFLQVCSWSSAAMCDQTFIATTFGPCDSCSQQSPLMNIYINSEPINYCSFCVEMVMSSFHFHHWWSKRCSCVNGRQDEWLSWVYTAVNFSRGRSTYDCCGSLTLFIWIDSKCWSNKLQGY